MSAFFATVLGKWTSFCLVQVPMMQSVKLATAYRSRVMLHPLIDASPLRPAGGASMRGVRMGHVSRTLPASLTWSVGTTLTISQGLWESGWDLLTFWASKWVDLLVMLGRFCFRSGAGWNAWLLTNARRASLCQISFRGHCVARHFSWVIAVYFCCVCVASYLRMTHACAISKVHMSITASPTTPSTHLHL